MQRLIRTARAAYARFREGGSYDLVACDAVETAARRIAERAPHLGPKALCVALYACDVVCIGRTGASLGSRRLTPPPVSEWQEDILAFAMARGRAAPFAMREDHAAIVEEVIDRTMSMTLHEIVAVSVNPEWSLRYMARGNRHRPVAEKQDLRRAA